MRQVTESRRTGRLDGAHALVAAFHAKGMSALDYERDGKQLVHVPVCGVPSAGVDITCETDGICWAYRSPWGHLIEGTPTEVADYVAILYGWRRTA